MVRRALLVGIAAAALGSASLAIWRTVAPRPVTADTIAEQLRCPACQGESVARSSSPIAAAMREVIAAQLAEGRSPEQVRQWLIDRYGAELLSDPPTAGWGLVLWLFPAVATASGLTVLAGRLRRAHARPHRAQARPQGVQARSHRAQARFHRAQARPHRAPARLARGRSARANLTWDLLAISIVVLAGVVAFASPRRDPTPAADPLAESLSLASSLERQERFAEAAAIYREVTDSQPSSPIRLRLAYCLLRSGQPAEAAETAADVLSGEPTNAQAVLLLGLAQRAQGLAEASATLQRFLELDPGNEAAPQVRRLLEQAPS
jgi:cytochrome c-type biogenesis protein CcmH/NrfF